MDVKTTHIYPWSAAEAAATPVPVPVVGGGSCVPRGVASSHMVTRQDAFELQQCPCVCAVALPAMRVASGSEGGTCWGPGQGSKCQAHGGNNNLN